MTNYTDILDGRNTSDDIGPPSKVLTNLLLVPFGIPICLENILAIIVLVRSSRLIYQVRILSVNLAITDCLAGFFLSIPDDIFGNCPLKKYFTSPFINVSLITVTLFNIDRCCSLKFALRYYEMVTPKVLKIACLLSWLAGMLISYMMFFDPSHSLGIYCGRIILAPPNNVSYFAKVLQVSTIMSNIFMYMYMFLWVYTRSRTVFAPSIDTLRKSNENPNSQNVQSARIRTQNSNTNKGQSLKNQAKVVKKMAVITGFFLFCCIPYFLLQIIVNVDYSSRFMRTLFAVTAGLMFLNSAINPVLYVWRFTESRYQLKRIIYCWDLEKLQKLEIERNRFFATYEINIYSLDRKSFPN